MRVYVFACRLIGTSPQKPFITGSEEMIKFLEPGQRLMERFVISHFILLLSHTIVVLY